MTTVCLHDKNTIEQILRRNVHLHIYGIGDLADFFWPYTTWYASDSDTGFGDIALLYTGQSVPTLLALSDTPDGMRDLVDSILHLLPQHFYAHLSLGVESILAENFQLDSRGKHWKMALMDRSAIDASDCLEAVALDTRDLKALVAFYDRCYSGHWFDPRMLETKQYFAVKKGGTLISAGGVHVYSSEYRVAALGNIATAPEYRNKGYARQVTARTCQSLLRAGCEIGLNVKADNDAAISSYNKLGFKIVASYGEYRVERK